MEIRITSGKDPFRIAVLSDTHIYCRAARLRRDFEERIRKDSPDLILHCGDVCTAELLSELGRIAPVCAVRGNRDLSLWDRLPPYVDIDVNGFRIHAEHGQGNILQYLRSKIYSIRQKLLNWSFDPSKVVAIRNDHCRYGLYCFGHSHYRCVYMKDGTVFLNPGHINMTGTPDPENPASYALVKIGSGNISVCLTADLDGQFCETDYNYCQYNSQMA